MNTKDFLYINRDLAFKLKKLRLFDAVAHEMRKYHSYRKYIGGTVKLSEMKSYGDQEVYYEMFKCTDCSNGSISEDDNFCSGCGKRIVKE